jgi:hypothetical protein
MKISRFAAPAMLAATLFLGACASSHTTKSAASMGAVNSKCPMTGEAVDAESPMREYNGKKVAFCCKGCAGKYEALTAEQRAAKLTAAK